jgi:hypothetical protein
MMVLVHITKYVNSCKASKAIGSGPSKLRDDRTFAGDLEGSRKGERIMR